MNKSQIWAEAARPKTFIASLSPVMIGSAMAIKQGFFNPIIFLLTLSCALALQIGTNYANDYFDFIKGADTTERKGPRRVTQSGLVSLPQMRLAIVVSFFIAALAASGLILFGGYLILFLFLLAVILGLGYTAGPYPLAYLGLGDLFVMIFFGPVAVATTYYLQTNSFSFFPLVAGIAPGALSTAILVMNNLRDFDEDKKAGKKTLVVRFGRKFGQIEYLVLFIIAAITPLFFAVTTQNHLSILIATFSLLPSIPLVQTILKSTDPTIYAFLFPKTGLVLLLYTVAFSLGWIL